LKNLGAILRRARKAKKLTQAAVATKLGISYAAVSQWESDDTRPERDRLYALAQLYDLDLATVLGAPDGNEELRSNISRSLDAGSSLPQFTDLPRDVPVRGTTAAIQGGFVMSVSVVDFVRRPPGIAHRKDAYSVYLSDDSMVPWRKARAPLYLEPLTSPVAGDHIIVELREDETAEGRRAVVRLVVSATAKTLRLRQYNPLKEIDIERKNIALMHRCLEWEELLRS